MNRRQGAVDKAGYQPHVGGIIAGALKEPPALACGDRRAADTGFQRGKNAAGFTRRHAVKSALWRQTNADAA